MLKYIRIIAYFTKIVILAHSTVISNIHDLLGVTGITPIIKKDMLNRLLETGMSILFLLAVKCKHGEFCSLIHLHLNAAFAFRTEYTF